MVVYMATPLAIYEQRDRKGLFARARAGFLPEFTSISDPYEMPANADVVLDTTALTPEEEAQEIRLHLERAGYIGANGGSWGRWNMRGSRRKKIQLVLLLVLDHAEGESTGGCLSEDGNAERMDVTWCWPPIMSPW